jgi:hypothetical protein
MGCAIGLSLAIACATDAYWFSVSEADPRPVPVASKAMFYLPAIVGLLWGALFGAVTASRSKDSSATGRG